MTVTRFLPNRDTNKVTGEQTDSKSLTVKLRHTWLGADHHFLPRMRSWEAAGVGHVFAGPELKHLHEAQRHAPLQKELLVKCYASATTPTAILKSEKETSDEDALGYVVTSAPDSHTGM